MAYGELVMTLGRKDTRTSTCVVIPTHKVSLFLPFLFSSMIPMELGMYAELSTEWLNVPPHIANNKVILSQGILIAKVFKIETNRSANVKIQYWINIALDYGGCMNCFRISHRIVVRCFLFVDRCLL